MSRTEGEITIYKNGCLQWNIKKFREVWDKGGSFKSPTFFYSGRKCNIYFLEWFNNKISLQFRNCSSFCVRLYITFHVRTDNIVSEFSSSQLQQGDFKTQVVIDFTDFLSKETWAPVHDHLTVFLGVSDSNRSVLIPEEFKNVELTASGNVSEIDSSYQKEINTKMINKLQEDLKSLLVSGENSDVKLVVRGKEFLAHRLILCTRSPVFKAMLCHDTSERDSGTVNIDDCDPDSFQDFLDYVYTGSTKHINPGNVISLYATSDKYFMSELKEVCVSFMKTNISVERFCGIATLALLHDEKELLEFSKNFFCKNSKEIIESKNWEAFFEENPKEAYEHFMKPLISKR